MVSPYSQVCVPHYVHIGFPFESDETCDYFDPSLFEAFHYDDFEIMASQQLLREKISMYIFIETSISVIGDPSIWLWFILCVVKTFAFL